MDADAVQKMGMTPADVQDMIVAWEANQQAWRNAMVAAGKFEWCVAVACTMASCHWRHMRGSIAIGATCMLRDSMM